MQIAEEEKEEESWDPQFMPVFKLNLLRDTDRNLVLAGYQALPNAYDSDTSYSHRYTLTDEEAKTFGDSKPWSSKKQMTVLGLNQSNPWARGMTPMGH